MAAIIIDSGFVISPTPIKVCRICLAIGVKMFHMTEGRLCQMYQDVTGINMELDDQLPKMFCWECAARLKSAHSLKYKATRAYRILSNIVWNHKCISIEKVQENKKMFPGLESSLTITYTHNYQDLIIEESIQDEIKSEFKLKLENPDLEHSGNNDFLYNDDETDVADYKKNTESDVEHIFVNENNLSNYKSNFIVDNDLKEDVLKDDFSDVNSVSKIIDIDKTRVVLKKEKLAKVTSINRVNVSSVKRVANKRTNVLKTISSGLKNDEFTVENLNFEQQIADMLSRSQSALYRDAPYKCSVCFSVFNHEHSLTIHLERHSGKRGEIQCAMCLYWFSDKRRLREHIKGKHTQEFTCKTCGYITTYRHKLADHLKSHSGRTFSCPHCDEVYTNRSTYFSHVRIKHPSQHACNLCGYTFINKRGVKLHKNRRHNEDKLVLEGPFCEICQVQFLNTAAYDRHLMLSSLHTDGKTLNPIRNSNIYLYKRVCGKDAGRINERRRGRACEVCQKLIFGRVNYNKHFEAQHPGHKQTKYVAKHQNINKPKMCEICGVIIKGHMKNHMLKHSGEAVKCPHCDALLKRYGLRRHIDSVHNKILKYSCHICGKNFTTEHGKKSHIAHVHQGQPRPKRVRLPRDTREKKAIKEIK